MKYSVGIYVSSRRQEKYLTASVSDRSLSVVVLRSVHTICLWFVPLGFYDKFGESCAILYFIYTCGLAACHSERERETHTAHTLLHALVEYTRQPHTHTHVYITQNCFSCQYDRVSLQAQFPCRTRRSVYVRRGTQSHISHLYALRTQVAAQERRSKEKRQDDEIGGDTSGFFLAVCIQHRETQCLCSVSFGRSASTGYGLGFSSIDRHAFVWRDERVLFARSSAC